MNVLYIAFKDFSKLHYGASKKVISECRAMEEYGHRVTLIGRRNNQTVKLSTDGVAEVIQEHRACPIAKLQPLFDKKNQIKAIKHYSKNKKYDFCYIRFDLCDHDFLGLLKSIHRICPKIFIEIPTYPYDKEYAGRINQLRLKIDDFYARSLKKYVSGIVTFYKIPNDDYYGIPCIQIPNGFDFDEVSLIVDDTVPDVIEIAAVSSMRIWHGYERLIEGLRVYYANGGTRDVRLHLVGNGREYGKYFDLTQKYALQDHVVFHGALHGEKLDALLNRCTLGVDSLGRHRTGICVLSSLKSREYGAKGIPFVNSCDIDIVDDDFEYMLKVPADETPVDIAKLVEFYDNIYADGHRVAVAKKIRAYIEEKSNMKAVLKPVLEQAEQNLSCH